jgi:type I restriction enzyme S subunit
MPFISPGDIGDSAVVAETKSTLSTAGAAMSRVIPPSSVCVVCIGSTIGKVALTTTESATNQQINSLTPGAYDPFFMLAAISHMRNEIRNAASTHAVPIINKSRFGEISIPKPNIERQRKFGSYISSSHKMLSQIMIEIQKYQHLKKSVASDLLSGRKRVSI